MATELRVYRFGVFEFDPERRELFRDGRSVSLQPQPAQLLATLLVNAGQIVSREELRRAVWPHDTFVDFDRGLNFCVAQIRTALADDAHTPRYVRTVPKRGYEFICPVVVPAMLTSALESAASSAAEPIPGDRRGALSRPAVLVASLAALAAGLAATVVGLAIRPPSTPVVAVARFDDETGDPAMARFADTLTDTVVEHLTAEGDGAFRVIGNAAVLRQPRQYRDLEAIGSSLHAQYVVLGQVQRDDRRVRVLAHLIRLPDQTHVKVSRTEGIAEATLATTDDVARRIATTFEDRLRNRTASASQGAPNR